MDLVVDAGHPGTPETTWRAWPRLASFPPLRWGDWSRVVVVAPHPDDEVLGATGMLLAARAAGVATVLVGVTDGEASHRAGGPALVRRRAGERTEALRRLGLGAVPVERLGLPDGAVADHRRDLADRLGALVRPGDVWVAPWSGDGHPDHDAAGAVAASVGAAAGVDVLAYLVWTWHWAVPDDPGLPWAAARRIDLGRRAAAAKRWATAAFGSQVRPGPDGGGPVLPDAVLRRSWRRHETYLVAGPDPGPVPG